MGSLVVSVPQSMATFGMAGYCIPAMIVAIPALLLNTRLRTVKKSTSEANKISSTLPFLFLPIACLLVFVIFQMGHGPRWDNFVPFGTSVGLDTDVGIALSIAYGISFIGPLAAAALASRMGRSIPILMALTVQFFVVISFQGQMEWIGFAVRVIVFQIVWDLQLPSSWAWLQAQTRQVDTRYYCLLLNPVAFTWSCHVGIFCSRLCPGVISYICAAALVATAFTFVLVSRKIAPMKNTI